MDTVLTLRRQFVVNGDVLDRLEMFKYLGHLLSQDDNDTQVMRDQMVKRRKC